MRTAEEIRKECVIHSQALKELTQEYISGIKEMVEKAGGRIVFKTPFKRYDGAKYDYTAVEIGSHRQGQFLASDSETGFWVVEDWDKSHGSSMLLAERNYWKLDSFDTTRWILRQIYEECEAFFNVK